MTSYNRIQVKQMEHLNVTPIPYKNNSSILTAQILLFTRTFNKLVHFEKHIIL